MRFLSTRGIADPLEFADAFAAGLAPDGGLYVPEKLPSIEKLIGNNELGYPELAASFFKLFDKDHSNEEIDELVHKSYSTFENPSNAAPLIEIGKNTFVLELFHGPTFAFKDFGLQLVEICSKIKSLKPVNPSMFSERHLAIQDLQPFTG